MPTDDDLLNAFVAIRYGEVDRLRALIAEHPDLIEWQLGAPGRGRRPLHLVTDWPGYFPNAPEIAQILIDAGAELDYRGPDGTGETALHWAASSGDADVAAVLIAAGADIEAADGSIGTPLDNAIGYGCWNVARLLVSSGARVDKVWHAAALGMTARLRELLASGAPSQADIDQGLWHACAGGQRRAAELLVEHGADLTFTPEYGTGSMVDAATGNGTQQENVITWLKGLADDQANPASTSSSRS
ncbi:MAG: ankyrin repeat domain-containing protein [Marmoricola sp.]